MQVEQEERCFFLDILHDLVIQVRMQILGFFNLNLM